MRNQNTFDVFAKEVERLQGRAYLVTDSQEASTLISKLIVEREIRILAVSAKFLQRYKQLARTLEQPRIRLLRVEKADTERIRNELRYADAGLTTADTAIAETGSIGIFTQNETELLISALPKMHIALITSNQIVHTIHDTVQHVRRSISEGKTGVFSFISGPSRTADIELQLILGVHGPHEVHVIVLEGEIKET